MSYQNNLNPISNFNQNNKGSDPTKTAPQQLPQQDDIPHTILVDCNRANSNNTKNGGNSLHKWTCEFAGGIEVKTGDQISVNSAFLNSIGVGDLIAWTKSGILQDNKTRWIFEYYNSNDGKNDKREGYNLLEGGGRYPYPYDNKPCELYRQQQKFTYRTAQHARQNSGTDYSYTIDPYINGRYFGLRNVFANTSFDVGITLRIDLYYKPFTGAITWEDNPFSLLKVGYYDNGNTLNNLDGRKVVPVGSYFFINAVEDPNAPQADRANLNNDIINYKYQCYGHYLHTDGVYYIMVERPIFWNTTGCGNIDTNVGDRAITARVKICGSNGRSAILNKNQGINQYGKPFNYTDPATFQNAGDTYYLYTNRGNQLQNTGGNHTEQIQNDIIDGRVNRQFGFTNNNAVAVKAVNNQSTLYSYKIVVNALSYTVGLTEFTDFIDFTIDSRYDGTVLNLTSVADLIALNNGIYNLTFSITRPNGTQELVVCYCNGVRPNIDGGAKSIVYVSPNRFTIQSGVYRDAENQNTLDQRINGNKTPSGNINTNVLYLHGYEENLKFDWDIANLNNARVYLSTTPYNIPTAVGQNDYPITNLTNPVIYGLVKAPPEMIEDAQNLQPYLIGVDYDNDEYLTNTFGYVKIHTNNAGGLAYNPLIPLAPQTQLSVGVKHYDIKDFIINDDYSSPSDIATDLTTQSHQIEDARDRFGNIIPNSKGKGLIQSKFLIPVFTSFNDDNIEPSKDTNNVSQLGGNIMLGSYYLEKQIYNYPKSRFSTEQAPRYPPNGRYQIYFRTKHTTINKPHLANGATAPSNLMGAGNKDFDVSNVDNNGDAGIPKAISRNENGDITGYPLQYIEGQECYISQFIGADTLTFNWNDTDSRFAISYMGQIAVDNFDTATGSGGDMSATVYIPNPVGQDGYNYKAPHTRYGGINIVNWCSFEIPDDTQPDEIYTKYNVDANTYTLDAEFDTQEWFLNTQINKNPIGNRFWNKLGFSDNQILTSNVGHVLDNTSGEYIPQGTTDILIDSAGGIITGGEPNENTPFGNTASDWDKNQQNTAFNAGTRYGGFGGLQFNNHNVGYGIPSTAGRPLGFYPNHLPANINGTNKFFDFESGYNPDREEHQGYTYKTDTDLLEAENLPIKTEDSYFYIISDLVKSDFFVSNENGFNANIIGILSKLNSGGDFIYQYQAPQQFYAKRDAIITSITTEILTTNFRIPTAIDPYSSVIYQITRFKSTPQPLQDPRFLTQNSYFNSIQQHIKMLLKEAKQPQKTKTERIQEIIKEVSSALVVPNDNQADIIQRITSNYDRLGLSRFRNNPQQYQQFLLQNPEAQNFINDLATFNRIQNRQPQAPTGITDVESITPETIEATMLNITPQENSTPVYLPPDQHQLATHIIDTISDAYKQGQLYTQSDLQKLIVSTEGIDPQTARNVAELGRVYLEGLEPVEPMGKPETNPFTVGLNTLTGIGAGDIDRLLSSNTLEAPTRDRLKSSTGSTSGVYSENVGSIADSDATITQQSEKTAGGSSGYYSARNRDISTTSTSSVIQRLEEAEKEEEEEK